MKVVLDTNILISGTYWEGDAFRILQLIEQKMECAMEAQADYIVTYDATHLLKLKEFEGIKIVSPTEFLRILV